MTKQEAERAIMALQEAINILRNTAWLGSNEDRDKTEQAVEVVAEALEQEPIIHCKDCKYYQPLDKTKPYDCYSGMSGVKENDFCSFAEPKGSD